MRRKGLLFVISLLALAALMAAMSFSSATVKANANLRITDASHGLVALLPGDGTNASDGTLTMDFTDGTTDKGIQEGSVYTWDNLFTIKNNSTKTINVKISSLDGLNNYITAKFYTANGDSLFSNVSVAPGDSFSVKATIDATTIKKSLDKNTFTIQITATQAN